MLKPGHVHPVDGHMGVTGKKGVGEPRVGEYRIVYQVLVEEKVVTIFSIRHRSVASRPFQKIATLVISPK